ATARPTVSSVTAHPAFTYAVATHNYDFSGTGSGALLFDLTGDANVTGAEPGFMSGPLEVRDGTTVVGTQEWYVVIFSTTVHR
ncbi:hypothetical protein, partial [Vibrio parahaemolyticus]|uniref:hypothetical protein n=1 Tax=Vibrio parahaemolyticus TaxID=670 RepID=UPI00301E284E